MARPTLSLVILIYNEELVIPELDRRLKAVLAGWADLVESWEVVFIKDDSLNQLRKMAADEPRYKVLSFARNFGHQMAITAPNTPTASSVKAPGFPADSTITATWSPILSNAPGTMAAC